jgi:hypothetical protein
MRSWRVAARTCALLLGLPVAASAQQIDASSDLTQAINSPTVLNCDGRLAVTYDGGVLTKGEVWINDAAGHLKARATSGDSYSPTNPLELTVAYQTTESDSPGQWTCHIGGNVVLDYSDPIYADATGYGDVCPGERGALQKEYGTYQVNLSPACTDFSAYGPNEFNQSDDNTHQPWGISKDVLFVKRAQIQEYATYQVRLTSVFRCPHINAQTQNSAPQSRHMYGDAMDMTPPLSLWSPPTEAEFNHLHDAASQTSPSFITDWTTYSDRHLHVDYR